MTSWADQIEEDLKWSEAELGSLKIQAAAAPAKSDRQRALLRALRTMLYAHYEGFCKFCWDVLLDQMEKDGCVRSDASQDCRWRRCFKTFGKTHLESGLSYTKLCPEK
jgi:hypothetical protein